MNNLKNIILSIISISIIFSSCTDTIDEIGNSNNIFQNETEINNSKFPWVVVLVGIKIVSEVVQGTYYEEITYYPNGVIKSCKKGCRGFWGTCELPSYAAVSGENLTLAPIVLDEIENLETTTINSELIKSDKGILYAIDKIEYPNDCEFFFDNQIKVISGGLIIDNPDILSQLEIDEPIIVKGEYTVYESENYKYIIIHE